MKSEILKDKDFRLLMFGKLVSLLGSNMQQFVLALYVLGLTGSATVFATVTAIAIVPRLVLMPFAGVFGDWFDRKKSIVRIDLLNGALIGAFAVIYVVCDGFTVPMIYVLVILLEITEIFFGSAMGAVIPSIVESDKVVEANSVNSVVMSLGNLIAPILAALVYEPFGMLVILVFNSASFIVSGISEMFIDIPKTHKSPEAINFKTFVGDIKEGIGIIRKNDILRATIFVATIINFSLSPIFSIGTTYVVKEILDGSDFQFGFLQVVLSLGMILAPIAFAGILKKVEPGVLIYKSFIGIFGVILLIGVFVYIAVLDFEYSGQVAYWGLIVGAFGMAMIATVANIALGTVFQLTTPLEAMGRAGAVMNLGAMVAMPLGLMLFGFLYDHIPMFIAMMISGVITLFASFLFKRSMGNQKKSDDKSEIENVDSLDGYLT